MKQTISLITIISLLVMGSYALVAGSYMFFEPEIINAQVATSTVTVSLTVTKEISITAPSAITMSTMNMTASSSIGTGASWNVKTNSVSGYALTLIDDSIPALQQTATTTFSDATTTAPKTWGFGSTEACQGKILCFGFSGLGTDVPTGTWGTGATCGSSGIPLSTLNWRGFVGTTTIAFASKSSETAVVGATSTMCVAAQYSTTYAPSGTYTTTITGTATAN